MLKRFTLAVGLLTLTAVAFAQNDLQGWRRIRRIILMMRKQEHWLLMEGWALITI